MTDRGITCGTDEWPVRRGLPGAALGAVRVVRRMALCAGVRVLVHGLGRLLRRAALRRLPELRPAVQGRTGPAGLLAQRLLPDHAAAHHDRAGPVLRVPAQCGRAREQGRRPGCMGLRLVQDHLLPAGTLAGPHRGDVAGDLPGRRSGPAQRPAHQGRAGRRGRPDRVRRRPRRRSWVSRRCCGGSCSSRSGAASASTLVLFSAAMQSIPKDIFEAALLDGASRVTRSSG